MDQGSLSFDDLHVAGSAVHQPAFDLAPLVAGVRGVALRPFVVLPGGRTARFCNYRRW